MQNKHQAIKVIYIRIRRQSAFYLYAKTKALKEYIHQNRIIGI